MTKRHNEFPKSVKLAAWQRANGLCEYCTARLYPGKFDYHHDKEDVFDGEASLENCKVLCTSCHGAITSKRAPVIAKSTRQLIAHAGIKRTPKGRAMLGSKASGIKKPFYGPPTVRSTGEIWRPGR